MDKVLAPILAGIGLGWLAFSPEGQKMAKGIGQTLMPALAPGQGQGKDGEKDGPEGKDAEGKPAPEDKPGKGDKDEEDDA